MIRMGNLLSCLIFGLVSCGAPESNEPTEQLPEPQEPEIVAPGVTDMDIMAFSIPDRCAVYTKYFLLAENPSMFAAQIDQESNCNSLAQSPYAYGIAQITPATGRGLSFGICKDLGPYEKFDDHWQLTCAARFMWKHENDLKYRAPYCELMTLALGKYNGGYWIIWEYDAAGEDLGKARYNVCGKVRLPNGRKRAKWACKENYEYAERIFKRQINFKPLGGHICS